MPTYRRQASWHRWRGTVADVAEAATVCRDQVAKATGGDDLRFRISVKEPGKENDFESIEEFTEGVRDDELESIESISVWVTGADSRLNVLLTFNRFQTSVSVYGSDQIAVDGVMPGIEKGVGKQGTAAGEWLTRTTPLFIGSSIGLLLGSAAAAAVGATSTLLFFLIGGAILGAVALYQVILARLHPPLELIPAGGVSKSRRFGERVRAVGGPIALVVLGVVLAEIVRALDFFS